MSSENLDLYLRCITVRFLLSATLFFGYNSEIIRTSFTIISFIFAMGFVFKIMNNFHLVEGSIFQRLFETNTVEKGFFGGTVWWHRLRYLHVVFWSLVGIFLLVKELQTYAWIFVAIDVLPGLFIKFWYINVDNKKVTESLEVNTFEESRDTIFKF